MSGRHALRRYEPSWARLAVWLLLALLATAPARAAEPPQVALVLSEAGGAYSELAQALRVHLAQGPAPVAVKTVAVSEWRGYARENRPALVVAVGLSAAEAVARAGTGAPVLNLLLPKQTFDTLAGGRPVADYRNFSAIYLDQPFGRQIDLIRYALPGRDKIGVLLGPASGHFLKPLLDAARKRNMKVVYQRVGSVDELVPRLRKVLDESDVLLALPDPLVFNRDTIQGVLLTTYRFQDPVIAFSPAYVRAGALAAVYTEPDQFGLQAAEIIERMATSGVWQLPPPRYAKYFSVSVNRQVARSLGLTVGNETVLDAKLRQAAEQKP